MHVIYMLFLKVKEIFQRGLKTVLNLMILLKVLIINHSPKLWSEK
jgi:hypothetical protein